MMRVIGQRQELSFYDVKLANKAYCSSESFQSGFYLFHLRTTTVSGECYVFGLSVRPSARPLLDFSAIIGWVFFLLFSLCLCGVA